MRVVSYHTNPRNKFVVEKDHIVKDPNEERVFMTVMIPKRLKAEFKAKVYKEGKKIQDVMIQLILGYMLR